MSKKNQVSITLRRKEFNPYPTAKNFKNNKTDESVMTAKENQEKRNTEYFAKLNSGAIKEEPLIPLLNNQVTVFKPPNMTNK